MNFSDFLSEMTCNQPEKDTIEPTVIYMHERVVIYDYSNFYCELLVSAGLNGLKAPAAPPLGVVVVFFFLLIGLLESLFFISDGGSFHP